MQVELSDGCWEWFGLRVSRAGAVLCHACLVCSSSCLFQSSLLMSLDPKFGRGW